MPTTDNYIAAKCAELKIHMRDAERKFEKGALGSSDDYLLALEVINDMGRYIWHDCLNYEEEESHVNH